MKKHTKAATRVLAVLMAVVMMVGMAPASVFALDDPISGTTGSGWDDFGGEYVDSGTIIDSGNENNTPGSSPTYDDEDDDEEKVDGGKKDVIDADDLDNIDDSNKPDLDENGNPISDKDSVATPTNTGNTPLGTSGVEGWTLSPEEEAEFLAFINSVEKQINRASLLRSAPGATAKITWQWGARIEYTTSEGWIVDSIPKLSFTDGTEGTPFCSKFGIDPLTGVNYTASAGSNTTILKLLIAYKEGKATEVGTQLAIWSITNAAGFAGHPEAAAALAAANSVSTTGYTYLVWDAGSGQPFVTLEKDLDLNQYLLKIVKKNADGSETLAGATFSVTGNGVNKTNLKTNGSGEILVGLDNVGTYTVTETAPPPGYDLDSPASQQVTVTAANTSSNPAVVTFNNTKRPPGGGDDTGSSAWGQVTIVKKDENDNPLKNAIFDIEVTFTSGAPYVHEGFQVIDGANTLTYQHPEGNTDQATVKVTEVQAPDGYVNEGETKTIHIDPYYTTWDVADDGTISNIQEHEGSHGTDIMVTFINYPEEATLIIYKYQKGQTGTPLAGAHFEIRSADTGTNWTDSGITGPDGRYTFHLPRAGTYIVTETKAPDGYVIDVDGYGNNQITVEVAKGETKELKVPNDKKGSLVVIKRDAQSGAHLQGATIQVTDILGNEAPRTQVTGPDGSAVFTDLTPGGYRVEEIAPPQYYELDVNPVQTIEIKDDSFETITLYFDNEPWTGLRIIKLDKSTAERLEGAVFGLYRGADLNPDGYPTGTLISEYISNVNGEVVIQNLQPGYYTIVEHQAPYGYDIDVQDVRTIQISPDDPDRMLQVVFRNEPLPKLKIFKRDAETGVLLPGATFTLRHRDGAVYDDITTGPDGTVLVENLPIGWYTVTEVRQPTGYLMPTEQIPEIELVSGKTSEITVYNHLKPSLTILKKDKVTGEVLPGATFRISWNNGSDYRDVTTKDDGKAVISDLSDGWYTIVETQAPEGYLLDSTPHQVLLEGGTSRTIELFNEAKPSLKILKVDNVTKTPLQYAKFKIERKTDSGNVLVGEYVSDASGIVMLEDIEPGRYLITEIQAPDGYNIDTSTHEITIEFARAYELEFTNTPKSPLYIQKVDEKGNPLIGAKFKVTTMNGAMVGTVESGRTGYAIIPYAEPGWYVVEEIQAPDGYILSNTPVNVEVKSGRPAQVEFVNYKAPGLRILKLDTDTREPLIGAKFKIAKASGELVGEYTTDINGLIQLEDLPAGAYVITELRAPDGYVLDVTPYTVNLEPGKTFAVEIYNTAKPGLQLIKKDIITGLPVGGARFNVTFLQNGAKKDLGSYTTSENGTFFVPDLTPGYYIITETKAADGYILDSTPREVFVEGGKLNTVEVFNTPYSDLRLLKIDSETRAPLEGAIFKLFDQKRLEIGTYTTTALGEIYVSGLPSGTYFIQEVKAPAGYVLDNTVRQVELVGGKTTTVEVKNTALGTLRILKIDADSKKPLYGATFLLYDSKDNLLGEYTTNQNGLIVFGTSLQAGTYKLKEIKAPEGYVLDETIHSINVKAGSTIEYTVKNELKVGNIQIVKVSDSKNPLTGDKKGDGLKGAEFEIFDEKLNLVDKIVTDSNGIATSDDLPLGKYVIKEVKAPKYYLTDGEPFYAEIKVHGDLIRFKIENTPEIIEVDITKRGIVETMAGEVFRYTFSDIANLSNCELEDFYWRDQLPTDAIRIQSLNTGTWSDRGTYEIWVKTNLKGWKKVKSNLHTNVEYTINMTPKSLGLASNEYVTEFKLEFGTVEEGFHATKDPFIEVKANNGLPNGYRFVNNTDVGGRRGNEWAYDRDSWITVIYATPNRKLPKTGGPDFFELYPEYLEYLED